MQVIHFDIKEFTASTKARELKIDNSLPDNFEPTAWATLSMLEGIRAHLSAKAGKDIPITITSGYRCPALNSAVGGESTSDHLRGMAADFRAPAFGTPFEIAQELAPHVDALGIGQLINEKSARGDVWVHVSIRKPTKAINRVITITDAGPVPGVRPT